MAAWALHLNRKRTANDTKRLESDRQRLVNETYVKAIEQLGHAKMEVRLGAIYALERIAATDRDYHWPITETLCAYIRERPASEWGGETAKEALKEALAVGEPTQAGSTVERQRVGDKAESEGGKQELKFPPTDIQSILNVFERRSKERKTWEETDGLRLNLHLIDLRGAVLLEVSLRRADLRGARVTGAYLLGTDLAGADLRAAVLRGAVLTDANLSDADLRGANLKGADLRGADLRGADLMGAKFSKHPSELGARWGEANPPKNGIETEGMYY